MFNVPEIRNGSSYLLILGNVRLLRTIKESPFLVSLTRNLLVVQILYLYQYLLVVQIL